MYKEAFIRTGIVQYEEHVLCACISIPVISNITIWMETQRQTNGDVITIGGQKPTLENSIEKDRITCYALMMLTAPITINPEN